MLSFKYKHLQDVKIKNAYQKDLGRELISEETISENMVSETRYFQTIIKIMSANERRVRQRSNFGRP